MSTRPLKALTPPLELTALKHLAHGKPVAIVAAIARTTPDVIQTLLEEHGPGTDQLHAAARQLTSTINNRRRATITHRPDLENTARPPRAPQRPAAVTQGEGARQPATRLCRTCNTTKPLTEFYAQTGGRDGHMSQCTACNNSRPPTEARIVRTRARGRAYATLAKAHPDEYARIFETELEKARAEHAAITAAAAAAGSHDAPIARLRPGPMRAGQQSVTERLDVARCQTCHTHHDADHECPNCGDHTPAIAPTTKPWQIRAWAIDQGLDVPTRGPIPDRVRAAYDARQEAS